MKPPKTAAMKCAVMIPTAKIDHDIACRIREADVDREEFKELMRSIKRNGILSPIFVRPKAKHRYGLVAGYNRHNIAFLLKLKEVPAIVLESISDMEALLIAFDENDKRIPMTPLQEAVAVRKAAAMIDPEKKMTNGVLCDRVGQAFHKSARWVRLRYELLDLPKDVKLALNDPDNQTVTMDKCHVLLRLTPECRKKAVVEKMQQFTKPAFEAWIERRVAKGKLQFKEKAAPKTAKTLPGKPVGTKLKTKGTPKGEMKTPVEVQKAIRRSEVALETATQDQKAFWRGKIAMGLEILGLDSTQPGLDAALAAFENIEVKTTGNAPKEKVA